MLKETKHLIFLFIIFLFFFFIIKYYFSDANKKKSYRSLVNFENRILTYSKEIPILENNTQNIIEYVKNDKLKKKKKYYFWELLNRNE
tara:strand:- start:113 stop:376 length:264 start_codon:yes stop_codon:yes gene_type:complete